MPYQFGVPEQIISDVMIGKRSPAAYSPYLSPLHLKHVIGVNNAYQLGHWIDVVFFGDNSWYLVHRLRLAKHPGLKVTCNPRFASRGRRAGGVKHVERDRVTRHGISRRRTAVAWNGNSGAAAINLAVHFGVKRIILLGFDMKASGGNTHWHGSHHVGERDARKIKSPPFKRHLKGFPAIAQHAREMGVEIINASPDSEIKEFPRMSVKEILSNEDYRPEGEKEREAVRVAGEVDSIE